MNPNPVGSWDLDPDPGFKKKFVIFSSLAPDPDIHGVDPIET
jgi:hypothetical protein